MVSVARTKEGTYDGFAREVAAMGAEGYPAKLLEIATRHGLRLAE